MDSRHKPQSHETATRRAALSGAASPRPRALAGTVALILSTGIVLLALMERSVALEFLPRSWYQNRPLWYFFALLGYAAGFVLLRHPGETPPGWQPVVGGRRFRSLVLYTRRGCHLCDEARDILGQHSEWLPPLELVDIDDDPQLGERFGEQVPVIEIDGRERFRGRVNLVLLRRLIEAAPPRETDA